jgi:hypothetical protein
MIGDFYRSKPWIDLMTAIRLERTNAEGYIICEHCGKPIVKRYDCIGHHVIELTEQNINDAMIALNPDNIQLVHHKCHNKIHDKLGFYQKRVYLVYGSPLSGKTSYVQENMQDGDLIIDVDNIWQCISGCDRYTKPNRLKGCVFAIRDSLLDMVRVRRGNWLTAWVVGGYPNSSERERLYKSLDARPIFVDTDKNTCMQRLRVCQDGRDFQQWNGYIDGWFENFSADIPPT